MRLGEDWKRVHADNHVHQQMWRDREIMARARGMLPMFVGFSTRPQEYRRHWSYARCVLCGWEGPATVAGRHGRNQHSGQLFDLKIIGVLGRYFFTPEME